MTKGFRDLIAWQKGMDLVIDVYGTTDSFPRHEQFGLISQMRRAAVSMPSNVAEGYGRRNRPDFQRFVRTARGSACELETQIEIAARLGWLDKSKYQKLLRQTNEVGRILSGLHNALETEQSKPDPRRQADSSTRH